MRTCIQTLLTLNGIERHQLIPMSIYFVNAQFTWAAKIHLYTNNLISFRLLPFLVESHFLVRVFFSDSIWCFHHIKSCRLCRVWYVHVRDSQMWKPHSNNNNGHFQVIQQKFYGFFYGFANKIIISNYAKEIVNKLLRDVQWSSVLWYSSLYNIYKNEWESFKKLTIVRLECTTDMVNHPRNIEYSFSIYNSLSGGWVISIRHPQ